MSAGAYQVFRTNGEPTHYGEIFTQPYAISILWLGLITALCMILANVVLMLLTIKWSKRKIPRIIGGVITLGIGFIIVFCIFGIWESGSIHSKVQYTAYSGKEITATVTIHVGLMGLNVTLVGDPLVQFNETINYNEFLNWAWDQGRVGFGSQGGSIAEAYRHADLRGMPKPMLDIVQYFTIDGELVRWGRYYRLAGYYTFILLWTAFPLWIVAFYFLLVQVFQWAAICFTITGITMEIAIIVWSGLRNVCPVPFRIPFDSGFITLSYSWAYGLVLLFGLISIFWGAGIYALYKMGILVEKKSKTRDIEMREKSPDSFHKDASPATTAPRTDPKPAQPPQQSTIMSQPTKPPGPKPQVSFVQPPATPNIPLASYTKGMIVQAKYSSDGKFYRARIDDIQGNQFLVSYLDFTGSQEWVHVSGVKMS